MYFEPGSKIWVYNEIFGWAPGIVEQQEGEEIVAKVDLSDRQIARENEFAQAEAEAAAAVATLPVTAGNNPQSPAARGGMTPTAPRRQTTSQGNRGGMRGRGASPSSPVARGRGRGRGAGPGPASGSKTNLDQVLITGNTVRTSVENIIIRENNAEPDINDLVKIDDLSEAILLNILRGRYEKNLVYTRIGTVLVSLNPFKQLNCFSLQAIKSYLNTDMLESQPHVFAIANHAFTSMLRTGKDQSIIVSGESGAGKTEVTKGILAFLMEVSTSSGSGEIQKAILDSNPVLEAFGNARTVRNSNSSRFGKFINIHFDGAGNVISGRINQYLLEKCRIAHQALGERNYHVFYQLCQGCPPQEREWLSLDHSKDYTYLNQGEVLTIEGVDDAKNFTKLKTALKTCGIDEKKQTEIFQLLAAILHLGNITFKDRARATELGQVEICEPHIIEIVGGLLGIPTGDLERVMLAREFRSGGRGSVYTIPLNIAQAHESRDALAKAIYGRLFEWLVEKINTKLDSVSSAGKKSHTSSIGVLDIFGFEIFQKNSLEQLLINFANEKLQSRFIDHMFKHEQSEYVKEGIPWETVSFCDNEECVNLVEGKPFGILPLLDEECALPKGSEASLLDKYATKYQENEFFQRSLKSSTVFSIQHFAGVVDYDVEGFMDKNKDTLYPDIDSLLQSSELDLVRELFPNTETATKERGQRQAQSGQGNRPKTLSLQFLVQLGELNKTLELSDQHYIRCIKPSPKSKPDDFHNAFVLRQLRCAGLMDTIRVRKAGYSYRRPLKLFIDRYSTLAQQFGLKLSANPKDNCIEFLTTASLPKTGWAVGQTKVFLKDKELSLLESERDKTLKSKVALIEKVVHSYLIRKKWKNTANQAVMREKERKRKEEEERRRKEEEERKRKQEEERKRVELERKRKEEEERKRKEEEEKKRKEEEERHRKQREEEERKRKEELQRKQEEDRSKELERQRQQRAEAEEQEEANRKKEALRKEEEIRSIAEAERKQEEGAPAPKKATEQPRSVKPPPSLPRDDENIQSDDNPEGEAVESAEGNNIKSPRGRGVPGRGSPNPRARGGAAPARGSPRGRAGPVGAGSSPRGGRGRAISKPDAEIRPISEYAPTTESSVMVSPSLPVRPESEYGGTRSPIPPVLPPRDNDDNEEPAPITSSFSSPTTSRSPSNSSPALRRTNTYSNSMDSRSPQPNARVASPLLPPRNNLKQSSMPLIETQANSDQVNVNHDAEAELEPKDSADSDAPPVPKVFGAPPKPAVHGSPPVPGTPTGQRRPGLVNPDAPVGAEGRGRGAAGGPARGRGAPRGRGWGDTFTPPPERRSAAQGMEMSTPQPERRAPPLRTQRMSQPSNASSLVQRGSSEDQEVETPLSPRSTSSESNFPVAQTAPASPLASASSPSTDLKSRQSSYKASTQVSMDNLKFFAVTIPKLIEHPDKDQRLRQKAIYELVSTEKDYVDDVGVIVDVFLDPIEKLNIVSSSEIMSLFSNLKTLVNVNVELLKKLSERIPQLNETGDMQVGDCFIGLHQYFKMYTVYCSNQPVAFATLEKCQKNPRFIEWLKKAESDPRCRGLLFNSWIIKPVQRICKYPLLLRDLLARTPQDHSDYGDITKAFAQISEVVDYINEQKRLQESNDQILAIQNQIDDIGENIVAPARRFIRRGTLQVGASVKEKPTEMEVFVFNDLLLIAKKKKAMFGRHAKGSLSCVGKYHLSSTKIVVLANTEQLKHSFEMNDPNSNASFVLSAATENERDSWVKDIRGLIKEHMKKELMEKSKDSKRAF